jgi:hypothetical protein
MFEAMRFLAAASTRLRLRPIIRFTFWPGAIIGNSNVLLLRDTIVGNLEIQFSLKSKKRKYKKLLSTKGDLVATPTHKANYF